MAPLTEHRQDRHVLRGSNRGPLSEKTPHHDHDFDDVTRENVFSLPCGPLVEVAPA